MFELLESLKNIDPMTWVWLGAMILFGIIEGVTAGLVSIWFVVGAVIALISALMGCAPLMQFLIFALVSAAALALTWPLAKKYKRTAKSIPTNSDRVLGQSAKVTETIDNANNAGAVYIGGKIWTARSADNSIIPVGEQVEVLSLEGVKLFVRVCKQPTLTKSK